MLSLTRKTDYALVAVVDLARQGSTIVSAKDLAKRLRMPLPTMQQILTRLRHRELVVSMRGPRGGYRLSKEPGNITLAELLAAIEGPPRLTLCCEVSPDPARRKCRTSGTCSITEPMRKVQNLLNQCLGQVTVAQLAHNTVPLGVVVSGGPK